MFGKISQTETNFTCFLSYADLRTKEKKRLHKYIMTQCKMGVLFGSENQRKGKRRRRRWVSMSKYSICTCEHNETH
jgi:hypothetical protein